MVGILSIGIHIPVYRLRREVIAGAWGVRSLEGERTVAGYDEDSLTMAVNAAFDCMRHKNEQVNGLFFSSTSSPYDEKQASATIATALDISSNSYTIDIASSRRGGTTAIILATSMVRSGLVKNVIVTASDCRLGAPQSDFEQRFGDAAAAVMIGDSNPIATILDSFSIYDEFFDQWRLRSDTFVRCWEERFVVTEGYLRVLNQAISKFLKVHSMSGKDFSKIILCGPDPRSQATLAKSLGFDVNTQLEDSLINSVGYTGTGAPLLMLAATLEKAKHGDKILLCNQGDGCDIILLEVTEHIDSFQYSQRMENYLSRKIYINYEKYLSWRELVTVEFPRRPESQIPSISCRWRERKRIFPLYGAKCQKCGMIQYPPQRICIACGGKDDFKDYKLSDKNARIFTFATDRLTPTKASVAINAFIEFEGGGRMVCELTDCNPADLQIGTPVEMTFRKLRQFPEICDYFWKARPILNNV